jgi:uncharacterized repeat protein (TIGR01451 family)
MKARQLCISLILGLGLTLVLLWLLGRSPPMARAQGPDRYDTYYVAPGGDCGSVTPCYASVQAAVEEASEGDTIKVAAGTYTDVYPAVVSGKTITQVVSIGKTITICGGYTTTNGFADPPDPVANLTTLDAQGQGRVLFITGNIHPTIEGLRIKGGNAARLGGHTTPEGDTRDAGGGVYVITAKATISNNQVFSNTANFGGGLYLKNSVATLSGNTIRHNEAKEGGGGLRLTEHSSATLSYNTIAFNTAERGGGGMSLANHCTAMLSDNDITANSAHRTGGGLRLAEYSSATLSHNTIKANTANFGGGLYLALTSTATISGNTFICNSAREAGGGLRLDESGSATLLSNTITANTAHRGGGMHLRLSTATLDGNIFAANEAQHGGGGLMLAFTSTATLSGNTFAANKTKHGGSGLWLAEHSSATLSGDTVIANTADTPDYGGGAGLLLTKLSTATLTNTIIADNRLNGPPGIGAGLLIADSSAHLLHTTIARNSGGDGSGIHVTERFTTYSTVALTNTILVSHEVGITVTAGNTVTVNGVLWHGTPVTVSQAATPPVIVQNQHEGDPAFVDPDAGNYHIGLSSEALDMGIEAGVYDDMDGDVRPFDRDPRSPDKPDLGADEFPTAALSVTKQASPDPVVAGNVLAYTLCITNTGPSNATGVTLTDMLPTEVRVFRYALPPTCTEADGTVTCDLGTLASDASETVLLGVEVNPSTVGTITNTVSVTANERDPDRSNNRATVETTVYPEADLVVTKTDWPDPVRAGQQLTYTLRVTNTGNVDLHATVTDTLPAHVAPTGTRTWTPDPIAPGKVWTHTVPVTVEVDYAGPLTNVIEVTTDEGAIGVYTETTSSLKPAIEVDKKASVDTAKMGESITYTYKVTNTGNVTLTAVRADDDRLGTIRLFTITLEPGQTTTGTATHTVVAGDLLRGSLVNIVTVTGTPPTGPDVTSTNSASVKVPRCLGLPASGAVLLVLLSIVLRRKK